MKIKISARDPRGFRRLGRRWSQGGITVSQEDFSETDWVILMREPHLILTPIKAGEEEDAAEAAALSAALAAIKAAIADLGAEAFQKDGKPKVEALKAALPEIIVTAALRDQAWAEVVPPEQVDDKAANTPDAKPAS